jgi:hypothetical protein
VPTVDHKLTVDSEPFRRMFERIRSHVERHQVAYSVSLAGITCFIMKGRCASFPRSLVDVGLPSGATIIRPLAFFSSQKIQMNTVAVIARDGRGHPGYIVQCKETGDIFLSQGGGAVWAGVSDRHMSRHLNGALPDVNGFTFERFTV